MITRLKNTTFCQNAPQNINLIFVMNTFFDVFRIGRICIEKRTYDNEAEFFTYCKLSDEVLNLHLDENNVIDVIRNYMQEEMMDDIGKYLHALENDEIKSQKAAMRALDDKFGDSFHYLIEYIKRNVESKYENRRIGLSLYVNSNDNNQNYHSYECQHQFTVTLEEI